MLPKYHADITRTALKNTFSPAAIGRIVAANLYQDRLAAQIGHDEYHFDNNAFDKGYAYIEEQRTLTVAALRANDTASAWAAFGRLTHTAQDLYAHSNYVDLWLSRQDTTHRSPSEIDPVDQDVLASPDLHSGKIYMPLEPLSFIKFLRPLVMPFLPRDSHAWMNIDSPEQGPRFAFAFQAAVKRTVFEFEKTTTGLTEELVAAFVGR